MKKGESYFNRATKELLKNNPNIVLAVSWMEKSFELKYPLSFYAMGTWYFHGKYYKKNLRKGIELWKLAAKHNINWALFDLAVSYEKGVGVSKNTKKAFTHYLKAALMGNIDSYVAVGRCYAYGIGVKRDRKIADIWLDKADQLGAKY